MLLRVAQDCRFAFLIGRSELPQNERAFIVQCKIRKKFQISTQRFSYQDVFYKHLTNDIGEHF